MRVGCIISMYKEVPQVEKNLIVLKNENCPVIVIQSDPGKKELTLDSNKVDHYELLSDVGGSEENYKKQQEELGQSKTAKSLTIPILALRRNFSYAFTAAKKFEVDWWFVLLGDMRLQNLDGIKKIIKKMENKNKFVGITRAIGYRHPTYDGLTYNRIQWGDATDFYPQFFIANHKLVKNGLFNNIKLTHPNATETCLGDNLKEYCKNNNKNFWDITYPICDYPAPKWIKGLQYGKDRTVLPNFLLGPMNWYRRQRMQIFLRKYRSNYEA
jgi:hypothetical protein